MASQTAPLGLIGCSVGADTNWAEVAVAAGARFHPLKVVMHPNQMLKVLRLHVIKMRKRPV